MQIKGGTVCGPRTGYGDTIHEDKELGSIRRPEVVSHQSAASRVPEQVRVLARERLVDVSFRS